MNGEISFTSTTDSQEIIDAFERCFSQYVCDCSWCYKDGPGFGIECRKSLLRDMLTLAKVQSETIKRLNKQVGDLECVNNLTVVKEFGSVHRHWVACSWCGTRVNYAVIVKKPE